MPGRTLFRRVAELEAAGRRSRSPPSWRSSGRPRPGPGSAGIVHPDGTIEGWVGGSCAQPVVVREALRSLVDGQPRLLRLSKEAPAEGRRGDGIVELVMTCHSGGTLEIYVEPHLPGAVAVARRHDADRGRARRPRDRDRLAGDRVRPDRRGRRLPGGRRGVDRDRAWRRLDPDAVAVRRRRHAGRVGRGGPAPRPSGGTSPTSASSRRPTRAGVVRAWLRDEAGIPEERLAALRAPSGLDLGAETPEEIAISILAELVQVRRGRASFVARPARRRSPATPP